MKDVDCSCGRTVKVVNYHEDVGTCVFCDLNAEGTDAGGAA